MLQASSESSPIADTLLPSHTCLPRRPSLARRRHLHAGRTHRPGQHHRPLSLWGGDASKAATPRRARLPCLVQGLEMLLGGGRGGSFDLAGNLWSRKGWGEMDNMRQKLEDLKELRDLVRSLGR
jgi:hypothetical protein